MQNYLFILNKRDLEINKKNNFHLFFSKIYKLLFLMVIIYIYISTRFEELMRHFTKDLIIEKIRNVEF